MGAVRPISIVTGTVSSLVVLALLATPAPAHDLDEQQAPARSPEAQAAGEEETQATGEEEEEAERDGSQPREAKLNLRLRGLRNGRLPAGQRITAAGTLRPFVAGSRVRVSLLRGKRVVKRKTLFARRQGNDSNLGRFALSAKLVRPGRYRVRAEHGRSEQLTAARDQTRAFGIRYPSLRQGSRGADVRLLNRLLNRQGYVTGGGQRYGSATARAVLAFRKVNRMKRTTRATSSILRRLADGKGGFELRRKRSGKYVEVDISRQVMVLAKGGRARQIYHVSTGKASTPTLKGSFRFYRREPGTNNVGMYYSVYYDRGYAIHGYRSVPTHPASNGCVRNPTPNSKRIYDWVSIGMPIYIY